MSIEFAVNDVFTVRMNYRDAQASQAFNILHYQLYGYTKIDAGAPDFDNMAFEDIAMIIAEQFYNNINVPWSTLASENVALTGITVQSVWPEPLSRQYTFTPPAPKEGLVESEALPLQDCMTFVKRTAYGQRWGVGRFFFVGLPESSQNTGRIVPGILANVNSMTQQLVNRLVFETEEYSFTAAPVLFAKLPAGGARLSEVTEVSLSDDVLKTQRRRRPGKGI